MQLPRSKPFLLFRLAASAGNFLKSHVDQFTRSDGTVVSAHDTKQQAAQADVGGGLWKQGHQVKLHAPGHPMHGRAGQITGRGHAPAFVNVRGGDGHTHSMSAVDLRPADGFRWPDTDGSQARKDPDENQKASGPDASTRAVARRRLEAEAAPDEGPDDQNPKFALSGLGSRHLANALSGKEDLNQRAKVELANRGMDSDGKWLGFNQAAAHHGVKLTEGEPDQVAGHFQTLHPNLLTAAAKGKLDLNDRARAELQNRGENSHGNWIGFKAAEKHHAEAEQAAAQQAATGRVRRGSAPIQQKGAPPVDGAPQPSPAEKVRAKRAELAARKPAANQAASPAVDPHPNVIGRVDPVDKHSVKFQGREYRSTGKAGASLHDDTPVREFEHADTGHRIWTDGQNRAHADSREEAQRARKEGRFAE